MRVIDSKLASCYYDVSIIPYWTYEVLTVIRVAARRGNQVQVLSDPVTVTEERLFIIPLYDSMRRGEGAMILKSGNLLCMARLNFRVKCNNQLWGIRSPWVLSAYWKQAFFYGIRLFVWIIPLWLWLPPQAYKPKTLKGMIKWQAILLRMHSFPPHIWTDPLSTPEQYRNPLKYVSKMTSSAEPWLDFFYIIFRNGVNENGKTILGRETLCLFQQ